jgi:hypothetical protein
LDRRADAVAVKRFGRYVPLLLLDREFGTFALKMRGGKALQPPGNLMAVKVNENAGFWTQGRKSDRGRKSGRTSADSPVGTDAREKQYDRYMFEADFVSKDSDQTKQQLENSS